jgi:hypothetical protein
MTACKRIIITIPPITTDIAVQANRLYEAIVRSLAASLLAT